MSELQNDYLYSLANVGVLAFLIPWFMYRSLQDELADLSAAGGEESKHLLSVSKCVTEVQRNYNHIP